jgi:hypothetical protein
MNQTNTTDTAREAQRIVREGRDVRRRIAELTLRTYQRRNLPLNKLAAVVEEILLGVVSGLSASPAERRDELLRQAFEGLGDAYAQVAERSRREERWEQFERRMLEAAQDFASRAGEDLMNEFKDVADRIRKAGERLKPKAKAAIDAIESDVLDPASQAASEGAKKLRGTLGVLMAAAGEMLQEFGKAINTAEKPQSPSAEQTAPTSASPPRSGSKTAPEPRAARATRKPSGPASSTPARTAKKTTKKPAPSATKKPKPAAPKQPSSAAKNSPRSKPPSPTRPAPKKSVGR